MRDRLVLLGAAALGALALFGLGFWTGHRQHETVLAMAWGDGKYGSSFYGAKITLRKATDGYDVQGRVLIGPDSAEGASYFHDCGRIGHVASYAEATRSFGTVVWKPDGLHVGGYFLPRREFENHR